MVSGLSFDLHDDKTQPIDLFNEHDPVHTDKDHFLKFLKTLQQHNILENPLKQGLVVYADD